MFGGEWGYGESVIRITRSIVMTQNQAGLSSNTVIKKQSKKQLRNSN